jgi:hypothetical protein
MSFYSRLLLKHKKKNRGQMTDGSEQMAEGGRPAVAEAMARQAEGGSQRAEDSEQMTEIGGKEGALRSSGMGNSLRNRVFCFSYQFSFHSSLLLIFMILT